MAKPRILVVGSCAMDLITSTKAFPGSGETVPGVSFSSAPGGKGANQAVQAALLGADVTMVGRVGQDGFGDALIASQQSAGIHTEHLTRTSEASSGISNIILEIQEDGSTKNRIIAVPGANVTIVPEDLAFLKETISTYDMVILQFEISMEINVLVARMAKEAGVPVMVNPAPAAPIPDEVLACATYLSPNEHEAAAIAGIPIRVDNGVHLSDVQAVAALLHQRGLCYLLVTLGENGAAVSEGSAVEHIPAVPDVKVADPTAAGDSFVAAFCTGICLGMNHAQAIDFARNTAAITVSRLGAQPSLPDLAMVEAALHCHAMAGFDFSKLDALKQ